MIVIIPAYEPDQKLYALVQSLHNTADYPIVIVNDGSSPDCDALFCSLLPFATVLTHEVNRGKGAAIKTALTYVQDNFPQSEGVITVDADGQHLPHDIVRVAEAWKAEPEALILGSRRFTGKVPFKSRAGNAITRFVFAISTGVKVFDTQTGLRAFGAYRIPMMLAMKGDRYEYEINVLLYATRHRVPIREVTIDTVYIEDNASSHFHPVRDAWRIYKMIFAFVASSLVAMVIDYILVLALDAAFAGQAHALLLSVIIARIVSSLANYYINCKLVFENRTKRSILRYYILAVLLLAVNYLVLNMLDQVMSLAVAKILVEAILYPVSFYFQRRFVFPPESEEAEK